MRSRQLNSFSSILFLVIGLSLLWKVPRAYAHGALVEINPASIEVKAAFDTGEPMDNAQVRVYSPADLEMPAIVGETDGEGRFVFSPDAGQSAAEGRWEVVVRKAGHGHTTGFELENGVLQMATGPSGDPSAGLLAAPQSSFTPQRWISMAAIIWGFVGTALYFKARTLKATKLTTDRYENPVDNRPIVVTSDSRGDR